MQRISYILIPFLLAGCTVQSQIQARYEGDKSGCQSMAEDKINSSNVDARSRASGLKTEFANCMNKEGWKLSTGQKKNVATNSPAPIWTPSGPGVNPVTASAAPASGAAARTATATKATTAAPAVTESAPMGSPATLSMPQTSSNIPQGASTYQPAVQPGRYFGPR